MQISKIKLKDIVVYDNNAKLHPDWQIEQIKNSIKEFGFNDPIVLDNNNIIIEGHGRYFALKDMGVEDVDCIKLEHMTTNEIKSYRLLHNKINLNTSFDVDKLNADMEYLKSQEFDTSLTGFTDIELYSDDDEYEMLELDDYEDEDIYNTQYICPNCNYVGDKKEFKEVYE